MMQVAYELQSEEHCAYSFGSSILVRLRRTWVVIWILAVVLQAVVRHHDLDHFMISVCEVRQSEEMRCHSQAALSIVLLLTKIASAFFCVMPCDG